MASHPQGPRDDRGPANARHPGGSPRGSHPLVHGTSTEFPRMPELNKWNERLTQAIEWYYQIFMLSLVLLFSLRHAYVLYSLKKRVAQKKNGLVPKEHHDPSTTSTEQQQQQQPEHGGQLADTELEPLLRKPSSRPSLSTRIHAWSILPPPDVPILGRPCETNAQFYFVLFFYVGHTVLLFFGYPLNKDTAYELGFRAGGLVISNLPWLFLLAVKNGPLKFLTGYSYESLNVLHRAQGYMVCVLAMTHGTFCIYGHKMLEWVFGFTLKSFLSTDIFIIGQVVLGLFILILLTALPAFRRRYYEWFQALHVFLQVSALCLIYWHNSRTKLPAAVCIGIYFWDRIVCRMWLRRETLTATIQPSPDGQTCTVSIVAPSHHRRVYVSSFKRSISRGWKPGQHVFISIPEMGLVHNWQAHPFSIASTIPEYQDGTWRRPSEQLELLIRAHKGFSLDLHTYTTSKPEVRVRLDGPYGSSLALKKLLAADTCLFVGGGTGISVLSPLAQAALVWHRAVRDESTHALIWVRQEDQHLAWKPAQVVLALEADDFVTVVPPATRPHGRPVIGALIEDMPNIQACLGATTSGATTKGPSKPATASKGSRKQKICLVVSGPDQMVRDTRRTVSKLLLQGLDIDLLVEKFEF